MNHLFVYGTLQNAEVVEALTGKTFNKIPYRLTNYKVLKVKNEHYPGMVYALNSHANGYLLLGIDKQSFSKITAWEGNDYRPVRLAFKVDNNLLMATTFLWKDLSRLDGEWKNQSYRTGHMSECIKHCIPNQLAEMTEQTSLV